MHIPCCCVSLWATPAPHLVMPGPLWALPPKSICSPPEARRAGIQGSALADTAGKSVPVLAPRRTEAGLPFTGVPRLRVCAIPPGNAKELSRMAAQSVFLVEAARVTMVLPPHTAGGILPSLSWVLAAGSCPPCSSCSQSFGPGGTVVTTQTAPFSGGTWYGKA